jgi:hypothetical protein
MQSPTDRLWWALRNPFLIIRTALSCCPVDRQLETTIAKSFACVQLKPECILTQNYGLTVLKVNKIISKN